VCAASSAKQWSAGRWSTRDLRFTAGQRDGGDGPLAAVSGVDDMLIIAQDKTCQSERFKDTPAHILSISLSESVYVLYIIPTTILLIKKRERGARRRRPRCPLCVRVNPEIGNLQIFSIPRMYIE
jgi:hypothetical protein